MTVLNKTATVERILNTAESMFAERGFAETSLRSVTARAQVNLAAVNYHFGSKKSLIQAVFDRFFKSFFGELRTDLKRLENEEQELKIEDLLNCFIEPLLILEQKQANGCANFMKLLSRAYTESQGHLRSFFQEQYRADILQFVNLVRRTQPKLSPKDLFWRLHFMLGTLIFAMAGQEALKDIAAADFSDKVDLKQTLVRLIPFLAAGYAAD